MASRRIGDGTIRFQSPPVIISTGTVGGPKESRSSLAEWFDSTVPDDMYGERTPEKAERRFLEDAARIALQKAGVTPDQVHYFIAGDLLNQIITASFVAEQLEIPYVGVYGACSTAVETLTIASCLVDAGYADIALAGTSSHYQTAERQYRYPIELNVMRKATSQYTVTGAGAALVGAGPEAVASTSAAVAQGAAEPAIEKAGIGTAAVPPMATQGVVRVTEATVGRVINMGIKDPNQMGPAMAPAAADTLFRHLADTGRNPDYYDMILTGDLGKVGSAIFVELMRQKGVVLGGNHHDAGVMIFKGVEASGAGGSGCACSALVTHGYVWKSLIAGEMRRALILATGALMSPTSYQQGESVPCVANAVVLQS